MRDSPLATTPRDERFADFWPVYLKAHNHPGTRAFHYAATAAGVGIAVFAVVSGQYWYFLLCPLAGYAMAWVGHRIYQGDNPLVLSRPSRAIWAAACDLRMCGYALTGRLRGELERHAIVPHRS